MYCTQSIVAGHRYAPMRFTGRIGLKRSDRRRVAGMLATLTRTQPQGMISASVPRLYDRCVPADNAQESVASPTVESHIETMSLAKCNVAPVPAGCPIWSRRSRSSRTIHWTHSIVICASVGLGIYSR